MGPEHHAQIRRVVPGTGRRVAPGRVRRVGSSWVRRVGFRRGVPRRGAVRGELHGVVLRVVAGMASWVRPSSRRPPAFGVGPPHWLKKNGIPALYRKGLDDDVIESAVDRLHARVI
jgi:hypothetical protein